MVIGPIVSGLRVVVAGGAAAAAELLGGERPRRRWSGNGRGWIELRVPEGSRSAEYATVLESTIAGTPGVARTQVNWPLSRLIVDIGENGPTIEALVLTVEAIELAFADSRNPAEVSGESAPEQVGPSALDIPGDAAEVINRVSLLAAK